MSDTHWTHPAGTPGEVHSVAPPPSCGVPLSPPGPLLLPPPLLLPLLLLPPLLPPLLPLPLPPPLPPPLLPPRVASPPWLPPPSPPALPSSEETPEVVPEHCTSASESAAAAGADLTIQWLFEISISTPSSEHYCCDRPKQRPIAYSGFPKARFPLSAVVYVYEW
jgi:hypothetical protein